MVRQHLRQERNFIRWKKLEFIFVLPRIKGQKFGSRQDLVVTLMREGKDQERDGAQMNVDMSQAQGTRGGEG